MSVDLLVSSAGGVAAFFIGWGMMRVKVADLERRQESIEADLKEQRELVHGLRDVYVSYQHFNEIMSTIRETQRELREDIKKVLDLLSTRTHA